MTDQLSEAVGKGLVAGFVGGIGYVIFYIINKVRENSSKDESFDDDTLSVSSNTFSNANMVGMKQFIWVGIFFIAVLAQAMQTNFMFALGVTIPWFVIGLVFSPIWWGVTKKNRQSPWQWFDWLNAGSCIMLTLFVLSLIVNAYMSSPERERLVTASPERELLVTEQKRRAEQVRLAELEQRAKQERLAAERERLEELIRRGEQKRRAEQERRAEQARRKYIHFSKIENAYKNSQETLASEEFISWLKSRSATTRDAYVEIYNHGTAEEIIQMLDDYVAYNQRQLQNKKWADDITQSIRKGLKIDQ